MEDAFIYEADGQTLIIHLPRELDHHNCKRLQYETDHLMAENTYQGLFLTLQKHSLWTAQESVFY